MAITGLEYFMEYFSEYKDKFVLIGGCACFINLEAQGLAFRATKDLDIVLLIDTKQADSQFVKLFWRFIHSGGYGIKQRSSGKPVFYRFERPEKDGFPVMIELFSRRLDLFELQSDTVCTPVPAEDDMSSLSAIILCEEYYDLVANNRKIVGGVTIVTPECLVALKAKAFLDLTARKATGELIDSNKIKKHKNDVFRLSQLFAEENRCSLSPVVKGDLKKFMDVIKSEPIDLKSLGLRDMVIDETLYVMEKVYGLMEG